jgi:hypothetical protein
VMFERLLAIRNDVALLAEEYDPDTMQFRGNFPQALSHLSLVNTAFGLARTHGSRRRTGGHKRRLGPPNSIREQPTTSTLDQSGDGMTLNVV